MRWPKSLTSPDGGTDSDPNGATTTSSLVDRAADQRVATLRWYAAALNSRRASAARRVAALEADLKKEMKRSEDAKRAMLEAAAGVRQRAIDAEADAAARRALETDLAKTKADLAKARRMNVEGQMTRSSLRIELAEAKASAEALAKAMADAELPTDTPDAHRAREETVKRAAERGAAERTSHQYAAFTPPASPQFMSPTVVSATKTVSGFYAKTPSRASSGAATGGRQPRQPSPRRGDLRDPRARPIDHPPGVGPAAHKPRTTRRGTNRGEESEAAFRDILVGAADYSTDVPHALLRARLHAAHRAAGELRARCAEHAAAAASAKAEAANASVEAADAARAATEATAALAESTRVVKALESRVERAEGAVAAAESAAADARMDAAASEADAAAARARLRVVVAREFERWNSNSNVDESNVDESNVDAPPNPPQSVVVDDDDSAMIRARLGVAETAVSEALESRASSERALAEGASALAAVIAERNALAARCDACVAELGDARARTARASAEAFELRRDADAQRRRADECESIANSSTLSSRG